MPSECHAVRNTMDRVVNGPGLTADESVEAAMVLFVSVGCLADVRRAAEYTMKFAQSTHAGRLTTPTAVPVPADEAKRVHKSILDEDPVLGLLRIVDGYVVGSPYWLSSDSEGTEIGALTLSEGAINDVALMFRLSICAFGAKANVGLRRGFGLK